MWLFLGGGGAHRGGWRDLPERRGVDGLVGLIAAVDDSPEGTDMGLDGDPEDGGPDGNVRPISPSGSDLARDAEAVLLRLFESHGRCAPAPSHRAAMLVCLC